MTFKKIYTARDPAEANIIRGMLASHGVRVEVRGEMLWSSRGIIPMTADTAPTIWVEEAQAEKAVDLIQGVEGEAGEGAGALWKCAKCGEEVDAELGECWQCGSERNDPPPPAENR